MGIKGDSSSMEFKYLKCSDDCIIMDTNRFTNGNYLYITLKLISEIRE